MRRLKAAPCGFIEFDDERRLIAVNDEAAHSLGYEPPELVGQSLSVLLPPAVRIFFGTYVYPSLAADGRAEEVYALLRRKDGSELPVLLNAARRPEGEGSLTECVFLVVKRRNMLERHLLHGLGEVQAPPNVGHADQRQAELSDRMVTLGTLLAGVMHEIRNPLTYVIASLDVLDRELTRPSANLALVRECVVDLRDGIERIHGLADAVGMVSRASPSGDARFDCAAVISAAVRLVRHRAVEGVDLKLELEPPSAVVEGEEARLAQVLMNLLVNAFQAVRSLAAGQGRVTVRHLVQGDVAIIEVSDNGPGVPEALRERIFDLFYTTKPVGEGTGLGLPISRQIVASFGGSLTLVSPAEGGATFRVTLPRVARPAPSPAQP